ncbi:MAG: hypothetical protein ACRES0_12425, partial [Pseudomonas sp.]
GINSLGVDLIAQISKVMSERVKKREALKLDFSAVLQEAKAIWGKDFSSRYNDVVDLLLACDRCSREYLSWTDTSVHINSKAQHAQFIQDIKHYLDNKGLLNAEGRMEKEIGRMTAEADLALEKKMLRGKQ